jgi:hypothetical protein
LTGTSGEPQPEIAGMAARDFTGRRYRFRLSRSDLIAYEIAAQRLDWRMRVVLTLMIGLAGLTVAVLPESVPAWLWWTVTVCLLAGAMGASVVYTNMGIRRRAAAHRLPEGETTVALLAEGIFEEADGRDRTVPYGAIGGLFETPGHLLLKAAQGPVVLPLAAFDGQAEMAAAAEWLRERIFRAKRQAAMPEQKS